MPTSLSPTDLANIALSKIGAQAINSITDNTSASAIACNTNFGLCYLAVSRASRWNCILTTAILVQEVQTPIPVSPTPSPVTAWAPNTAYAANIYLAYGNPPYIYQTLYAYTSTNNFLNDLTTGALIQTNLPASGSGFAFGCGSQYPSGWGFKYALPADFQLMASLNENVGWWGWDGGPGSSDDFEIMGASLYCDQSQAVIQYVRKQPDCSQFDSLFTDCLTFKLAAAIATTLRQDGGRMEQALNAEYKSALREARTKNGGEKQSRRFNPIGSSRFLQSRYRGVNG